MTTSRRAEGALLGGPESDGGTAEPDDVAAPLFTMGRMPQPVLMWEPGS